MPRLEFRFDLASTYSYVAAERIGERAVRAGESADAKQALRDRGEETVRVGLFGTPSFRGGRALLRAGPARRRDGMGSAVSPLESCRWDWDA